MKKISDEKKKEYEDIKRDFDIVIRKYSELKIDINKILVVKNQKKILRSILDKLHNLKSSELLNNEQLFEPIYAILKDSINTGRETRGNYRGNFAVDDNEQSELLEAYQQIAQIVRTCFGRFEIKYDKYKNELLSNDCKRFEKDEKEEIEKLIKDFLLVKEVFYDLQSLYSSNPLENKYLEEYFVVIDKYGEFLFIKLMALQKIINMDEIYITPSSTNMKNFDLITIEVEKTNKITNHTEKYNYDIYIKGGLKIDFSAGIFATSLINDEYRLVDSLDVNYDPTNKKMIQKVNKGNLNIGFGGMVNITKRSGASWLAPGISFGLILSTQPSLQFTSGLTLSIGKTERLLIHAGYAMGFVKRVDGLPVDEYMPTVKIGNDVRTIDQFLIRPFFGLTYNLSKNKVFKATTFSTSTGSSSSSTGSTQ